MFFLSLMCTPNKKEMHTFSLSVCSTQRIQILHHKSKRDLTFIIGGRGGRKCQNIRNFSQTPLSGVKYFRTPPSTHYKIFVDPPPALFFIFSQRHNIALFLETLLRLKADSCDQPFIMQIIFHGPPPFMV